MDSGGHIIVDDYQNTSAEKIYALGDVCGKWLLTPGKEDNNWSVNSNSPYLLLLGTFDLHSVCLSVSQAVSLSIQTSIEFFFQDAWRYCS